MNFVNHSPHPSRHPDSQSHSPDCGGMPKAIGRERTNLPSRTKAGCSWVHAHLHRKKADLGNAAYWYSRVGKPVCREQLDLEWLSIVSALLG